MQPAEVTAQELGAWDLIKQQVLAVAVLPALLFAEALVLQPFGRISKATSGAFMILGLASGPLWGYWIPRRHEYRIARWTWVWPLSLFLVILYPEFTERGFRYIFDNYFWPPDGNEGLGILITLPVFSAILYSVGAAVGWARSMR